MSSQADTPIFTQSLQFCYLNHNDVNVLNVRFAPGPTKGDLSSLFGNVVHLVVREAVPLIASAMLSQEAKRHVVRGEGAKVEPKAGD